MANVFVTSLKPPRIARNKRIYSGNTSNTTTIKNAQTVDAIHMEYARLTDLVTKNVVVYFVTPFLFTPTGWIKVYRMREIMTGKWKQQDVLYYHAAEVFKNEYGFGLVIDDKESLTGVVVEYFFI
jgi:hypothetical protein